MNIIIFTGLSASGKTTISKRIAEELDLPRIDLHKTLHKKAVSEGFDRARDWILTTGIAPVMASTRLDVQQQIEDNRNPDGIILDEVLDLETLNYLKTHFSEDNFKIFYIRTNRHDRVRFMTKRIGKDKTTEGKREMKFIDRFKERLGIRDIIDISDYRFENFGTLDSIINEISTIVRSDIDHLSQERKL